MKCPMCDGSGEIEGKTGDDVDRKTLIQNFLTHSDLSYSQIAEKIGISKPTVGYYVKRYNLKRGVFDEHVKNPESRAHLKNRGLI